MGNIPDKIESKESLDYHINIVAGKYIFQQNFQDLINLKDPEYCNKLVILTSKIIKKSLSSQNIQYLYKHIHENKEIDIKKQEDIIFLNKNTQNNLDIKDKEHKRQLCIGISAFYIKINYLFAAIVTTLKPVAMIKKNSSHAASPVEDTDEPVEATAPVEDTDEPVEATAPVEDTDAPVEATALKKENTFKKGGEYNSKIQPLNLENNEELNKDEEIIDFISNNNLCNRRLNILTYISDKSNFKEFDIDNYIKDTTQELSVNPSICNTDDKIKNIFDEEGIPELEKLYFDIFDHKSGTYTKKSEQSEKLYQKDLKDFYETFTGKRFDKTIIKSFKDINIKDFNQDENCKNNLYNQKVSGRNETFKNYSEKLQIMLKNIITRQDKLIKILNEVFYINKKTDPVTVSINYNLKEKRLNELIITTRKLIKELYIGCEKDFQNILKIYFVLVKKIEHKIDINQVTNLQEISNLNVKSNVVQKPSFAAIVNAKNFTTKLTKKRKSKQDQEPT